VHAHVKQTQTAQGAPPGPTCSTQHRLLGPQSIAAHEAMHMPASPASLPDSTLIVPVSMLLESAALSFSVAVSAVVESTTLVSIEPESITLESITLESAEPESLGCGVVASSDALQATNDSANINEASERMPAL
jgi:hypothetical protein